MPVAKREAHYRAVENGEIHCYQCNVQLYSGWRACYKCGAPLTEGTAEEMQLAADTPERREYYESLLTGGKVKRRSARGMANEERANFERLAMPLSKKTPRLKSKPRHRTGPGMLRIKRSRSALSMTVF